MLVPRGGEGVTSACDEHAPQVSAPGVPRLFIQAGLATAWGLRLTYNFARKGQIYRIGLSREDGRIQQGIAVLPRGRGVV